MMTNKERRKRLTLLAAHAMPVVVSLLDEQEKLSLAVLATRAVRLAVEVDLCLMIAFAESKTGADE